MAPPRSLTTSPYRLPPGLVLPQLVLHERRYSASEASWLTKRITEELELHDLPILASETVWPIDDTAEEKDNFTNCEDTEAPQLGTRRTRSTGLVQRESTGIPNDSTGRPQTTALRAAPDFLVQHYGAELGDYADQFEAAPSSTWASTSSKVTRRMRDTSSTLKQRRRVVHFLEARQKANEETSEEDVIWWYIERAMDDEDIETEEQIYKLQYMAQVIIGELIDEGAFFVARQDPRRPERRILMKNPYVQVGD